MPHVRAVGNQNPQKIACIIKNPNPRQTNPGRAREGENPLAPRHSRGCRGVECPTPASSETKALKRIACFVGNQNPRQNIPGRAREGRSPLALRRPRGSRGAERPTPSETKAVKRIARFVGNKNPCQNSHGRAREDVNLLDFQSRPATCASERLLAQRAGKSLCDRPSEIKDFAWSSRALIFFGVGACPPGEKIASLQIPRPEIRRISAESEKGWCGGESVLSAPG